MNIPAAALLPHEPPMRLIDNILHSGTDFLWTDTTPLADSVFADDNGIPACIGLEYLAQTAAAFFTLQEPAQPNAPRQGMLIACRDFQCSQPSFPLLVRLLMRVTLQSNLQAVVTGHGLIKFNGEIFAAPDSMSASPAIVELEQAAQNNALTTANLSVYI